MTEATDWTSYYRRSNAVTSVTRRITGAILTSELRRIAGGRRISICEFGGAGGGFIDRICGAVAVDRYHVVDDNAYGLSLLAGRNAGTPLTWTKADVLNLGAPDDPFDIVFSVGLIEHFDREGTAAAIASHFRWCRPAGTVLITFPTPTLSYRIIRGAAERLGIWAFPDERPLRFPEVRETCVRFGRVDRRFTNNLIGLSQGYVIAQRVAG